MPTSDLNPPGIKQSNFLSAFPGGQDRIGANTFINGLALFVAARIELKRRRWSTGYSLALGKEEVSANLNLDREVYQQMAAVTGDHGTCPDPADCCASPNCRNRPDPLRLWVYRRLIGGINQRVAQLRGQCAANAADIRP